MYTRQHTVLYAVEVSFSAVRWLRRRLDGCDKLRTGVIALATDRDGDNNNNKDNDESEKERYFDVLASHHLLDLRGSLLELQRGVDQHLCFFFFLPATTTQQRHIIVDEEQSRRRNAHQERV